MIFKKYITKLNNKFPFEKLTTSVRFLTVVAKVALPLMRYRIHAKRRPTDLAGLGALESNFLPIFRSTHSRRVVTALAIAGVPRIVLPGFLGSTTEEYPREADLYRAQSTNTSALLNEHLNCFVGDSHAEFYSRAYASERRLGLWDPIAFWLGSKTLLGYVSAASRRQLMDRLQRELAPFIRSNKTGRRSIALCWTLGSIDVRSSFREILIRSATEDVSEVTLLFEKTLARFIEDVVLPFENQVASDCPGVTVRSFFLSAICPTTPEIKVQTVKDVREARKIDSAPTLGSLANRMSWTQSVNTAIDRICKTYGVQYCDLTKWILNAVAAQPYSADQVHLTFPSVIRTINDHLAITTNVA